MAWGRLPSLGKQYESAHDRFTEREQACAAVLAETLERPDEFRAPLQGLCLTPGGRHGGASTTAGATYSVITADDESVRILGRAEL
jgi:hypothetical protein